MCSLKNTLMCGESLHFGLMMRYAEECGAHHSGRRRLFRKYGSSQCTTFPLVRYQGGPRQYLWDAAWGTAFLLAQTNMFVCFRLTQSYFHISQTWIFNYFVCKMCPVQLSTLVSASKLTTASVQHTYWDLTFRNSHFHTVRSCSVWTVLHTYIHTTRVYVQGRAKVVLQLWAQETQSLFLYYCVLLYYFPCEQLQTYFCLTLYLVEGSEILNRWWSWTFHQILKDSMVAYSLEPEESRRWSFPSEYYNDRILLWNWFFIFLESWTSLENVMNSLGFPKIDFHCV